MGRCLPLAQKLLLARAVIYSLRCILWISRVNVGGAPMLPSAVTATYIITLERSNECVHYCNWMFHRYDWRTMLPPASKISHTHPLLQKLATLTHTHTHSSQNLFVKFFF